MEQDSFQQSQAVSKEKDVESIMQSQNDSHEMDITNTSKTITAGLNTYTVVIQDGLQTTMDKDKGPTQCAKNGQS